MGSKYFGSVLHNFRMLSLERNDEFFCAAFKRNIHPFLKSFKEDVQVVLHNKDSSFFCADEGSFLDESKPFKISFTLEYSDEYLEELEEEERKKEKGSCDF